MYTPAIIAFWHLKNNAIPGSVNREVTILNNKYKIHIQGREVRMIGAPNVLKHLKDIEFLVDCVNFININCKDIIEIY